MVTIRRTGRILENTWECSYCGKRNRGRDRECVGCGRPKGKDIEYDHNHIAVLEGEEALKYRRPDWFCECCDSFNPDKETSCVSCGAPRGASKDYFQIKKEEAEKCRTVGNYATEENCDTEEGSDPTEEDITYIRNDVSITGKVVSEHSASKSSHFRRNWNDIMIKLATGAATVLAIVAFIWLFVWLLTPEIKEGTVTDLTWETSISLEELTTIRDEGWDLPSDARVINSYKKYKKTTQVVDYYKTVTKEVTRYRTVQDEDKVWYTYEDLGNGFDEEIEHREAQYHEEPYTDYEDVEVPVYKDVDIYEIWYVYEYDRWKTIDTKSTRGSKGEEHDPEIIPNGDKQRTTPFKRSFRAWLDMDGESFDIDISKELYDRLKPGDEVTLEVHKLGLFYITEINGDPIN